jgi:hypothetical protein
MGTHGHLLIIEGNNKLRKEEVGHYSVHAEEVDKFASNKSILQQSS